jgi:hypothetical protein
VLDGIFARLLLHYLQSFANNATTIAQIGTPARLNKEQPQQQATSNNSIGGKGGKQLVVAGLWFL